MTSSSDKEAPARAGTQMALAAPFVRLRLIKDGKQNPTEGRLEVLLGPWWGAVCGDTFQAPEAQVVCRMQGKSRGKPRMSSVYGLSTTLGVIMSKVDCNGTERGLGDCRFDRGRGTCGKGGHTGVQCYGAWGVEVGGAY